jgi:hypothetical protein
MNLSDHGIAIGRVADIVVLDCASATQAIAELALPLRRKARSLQLFAFAAGVEQALTG